ncbi:MAG: ATP-binding protein [Myxococcota bacterium]
MLPSDAAREAVEATIRRSVTRGERLIAAARLAIGALAISRSAVVWSQEGFGWSHGAVLGSVAAFGLSAVFLIWEIVYLRKREATGGLLAASVLVDTLVCAGALSTNSLFPGENHPGILFMPDLAALVLVSAAAGLRLSVGVAAFSGVTCLAALGGVVWLDAMLFAPLDDVAVQNLTGIAGLVIATAVIGGVTAARTRHVVRAGAVRALEAERTTRNLGLILRSHHDVRTLLSSVGLNADLLNRELEASPWSGHRALLERSRELRRELDQVNDFVAQVKERSYGELLSLEPAEAVRPDEVARGVAAALSSRFPEVAIDVRERTPAHRVMVAGGVEGLHHVLQQLVLRAVGGPGSDRASRIAIEIGRESGPDPTRPARTWIEIFDDGGAPPPGRDEAADRDQGVVEMARRVVEAGGGRIETAASPQGREHMKLLFARAPERLARRRASLTPDSERAVEETLREERARGERLIAIWRVVLGGLSIGRSIWVWNAVGWGAAAAPLPYALSAFGVLVVFSVVVVRRVRGRAPLGILITSALVDVGLCVAGLSTNVLWPEPGYRGLIFMPELAAFTVPTLVSGIRLSLSASAAALLASLAGLASLLTVDVNVNGPMGPWAFAHLSALLAPLGGVAVVAVITVLRTRNLVREGAEQTLVAERAGRNLGRVLESHQDVRALLSSANANAAWLDRALSERPGPEQAELRAVLDQLSRDLEAVDAFVAESRERSYADLLVAQTPAPAPVGESLAAVLDGARRRFSDVELTPDPRLADARVEVTGGAEGLHHVLHNLVVNACEGNGERGAARVAVRSATPAAAASVAFEVIDDGPGFPREWLESGRSEWPTTKPEGSGLGLLLVRRLVEASGGRLELSNRMAGGACVRVSLPGG